MIDYVKCVRYMNYVIGKVMASDFHLSLCQAVTGV